MPFLQRTVGIFTYPLIQMPVWSREKNMSPLPGSLLQAGNEKEDAKRNALRRGTYVIFTSRHRHKTYLERDKVRNFSTLYKKILNKHVLA